MTYENRQPEIAAILREIQREGAREKESTRVAAYTENTYNKIRTIYIYTVDHKVLLLDTGESKYT